MQPATMPPLAGCTAAAAAAHHEHLLPLLPVTPAFLLLVLQ
jgi:hypothetical protein